MLRWGFVVGRALLIGNKKIGLGNSMCQSVWKNWKKE